MDNILINNINKDVKEKDNLFIVGDFSFRNSNKISDYRKQIKCKHVFLILGNHDPRKGEKRKELDNLFEKVSNVLEIKSHNKYNIFLFHYAMKTWNRSHYGSFNFYGHSHYILPDDPYLLSLDVGIDAVAGRATGYTYKELKKNNKFDLLKQENYKPLSFHEIKEIMSDKASSFRNSDKFWYNSI